MRGNIKKFLGNNIGTSTPVFVFSLVILFWAMFDGILTYIVPILIEEQGFSTSMIGFIIGTSSITGAFFDFLICKFFKNLSFRRIFLIMFAICFVYPLLLWSAKSLWFFLFVMAVWGIYFDFFGFGVFNFIGRYTKKKDHSSSFGTLQIFKALGGILAPLIVGFVIVKGVDWRSFALGWFFLAIGFIFFIVLIILMHKKQPNNGNNTISKQLKRKNFFVEIRLWKKIGRVMMPVLFLTFYLFFIEAFFWTLAPLYTETAGLEQFSGFFLTAYSLPFLIVGWFVGSLNKKFGKKKTAFVGLLVGSLILSFFSLLSNPIILIFLVFFSSFFISVALPSISATYADYISEASQVEEEIEGIEDFAFNAGYILGPIFAGVLADIFSIPVAFSILGLFGVLLATILLFVTPKSIIIKTKPSELK